ncbi:Aspartate/tyrosine/aromatic aminotransferase [Candidatus Regiella insecticola 5.15]|uniref:Aminotransferase n=1 Tax=Candidatus Regiella insecticola 5.15 TaxID=1005043 RepID=G2GW85_9ENTR|nr:amino acid aminotransferase [Candidatus Regiella insecticola]EGY29989.1 Aspartate/tyrosine/aromatic aminotransferase [Candidatus Regiella insecticola 5.15]
MFENIELAPADPILGLAEQFNKDPQPNKINLGIGVYQDETGKTPVLSSVKKAEQYLLENETSKNYLSIDGLQDFARCTQALLFGESSNIIEEKRARTAQTPGGTGALRVAADFIAKKTEAKRVLVSNPTWPNHHNIFPAAGLEVVQYDYYDALNHCLDFDKIKTDLRNKAQAGDVVLFHGCCHNPTGIDPTLEQWQELAKLLKEKNLLPLFDFAYQGFATGLEEDAKGLRAFAKTHNELIVCSSYSKNFGLYNERVGACTLVAASPKDADNAFSQIKSTIRANYSNPPAHGAAVVAAILNDKTTLRPLWEKELTAMRQRIKEMRDLFVETLEKEGANFSFIKQQNGMFSYSGLTANQVTRLRKEFSVHAASSGRINIAGMTKENMSALCEAIIKVL